MSMGGGGKSKGPTRAERELRRLQAVQAAELRDREREEKRTLASRSRAQAAARGRAGVNPRGGGAALVASAFGSQLSSKLGGGI